MNVGSNIRTRHGGRATYNFGLFALATAVGACLSVPALAQSALVLQRLTINEREFVQQKVQRAGVEVPVWFLRQGQRLYEVMLQVVTVKFKSAPGEAPSLLGREIQPLRRNPATGAMDIPVPPGVDPVTYVKELQAEVGAGGKLEYAEVNTYGQYDQLIPDDPDFDDQWGLDNQGQTGGTPDADVDAPEAWEATTGNPNVVVAVLDSGTDIFHEDLNCNIWVNPGEDLDMDGVVWDDPDDLNGVDDDGNGLIDDLVGWDFDGGDNQPWGGYFHGTHVAGILGACGNNATGVIGLAGGMGPGTGSRMMILGVGNNAPNSAVLDDAIVYAADQGARVITMSLSVSSSNAIDEALDYAYNTMGVFINNSSGNNGPSVDYPATDPNVMAVGATDHNDVLAGFSNTGPEVEVSAPGVNILSTRPGDTYDSGDGTSYASPLVAGTAALMFSINPAATNEEVRDCIIDTAEDLGPAGHDNGYGWGRLNTADALDCITPNMPPVCDADGPYEAECGLTTTLNGTGSSDPENEVLDFEWTGPFTPSPALTALADVVFAAPLGAKVVDLTVSDPDGLSDSCNASVTVVDTTAPDIAAPADVTAECTSAEGTPVDLGTPSVTDICDASPTVTNDAPALFPYGRTVVTWTATDASGNFASDDQQVDVVDTTPPEAFCNAPATIVPPDAPISFTATATDTCGEADVMVTDYDCFEIKKNGKRVDKTESCVVFFDGASLTVADSGGVGDNISWTLVATDEHGNSTTVDCALEVINPGQNK